MKKKKKAKAMKGKSDGVQLNDFELISHRLITVCTSRFRGDAGHKWIPGLCVLVSHYNANVIQIVTFSAKIYLFINS